MPQISVAQLFDDNRDKLRLAWIAGRDGGVKMLDSSHLKDSHGGLIGHLNFIHPNWIQILARPEIDHLNALDTVTRQQTLHRLATSNLACIVVAGGEQAPEHLCALADTLHVALFASPLDSVELMWMLRPYLARALAESTTEHGVFLDVLGMGVMITGDSGVGKSELALELISRGSGLIADDVIELYRIAPETLEGRCPVLLCDFPRSARPGRAQHPHHFRRSRIAAAQKHQTDRAPGKAGRQRHPLCRPPAAEAGRA